LSSINTDDQQPHNDDEPMMIDDVQDYNHDSNVPKSKIANETLPNVISSFPHSYSDPQSEVRFLNIEFINQ